MNAHRVQNTEEEFRHVRVFLTPIGTVLQPHVSAAGEHGRQITRVVCRACPRTEEHDRIVESRTVNVLVILQAAKEVRDLLTKEAVELGKLQLPIFIASMGKAVMGASQSQLQGKCIADSHPIFAIEHEGN